MFIDYFTRGGALASGLAAPLFLLGSAALAQAPSPTDPADPAARVAAFIHQPLFQDYNPMPEVSLGSWREANDTVGRIGGWRAYAREANAETVHPGISADPEAPGRSSAPRHSPGH